MRTSVYLPSYVEWLTCLEMERDVRKMRQGRATYNGWYDASKGTPGHQLLDPCRVEIKPCPDAP
jgi:hypothetical protein